MYRLFFLSSLCLSTLALAEHATPGRARQTDPSYGLHDVFKIPGDPEESGIEAIARDMQGPFCGPASVTMALKTLGAHPDFKLLRNLSWTTGFHCIVEDGKIASMWPTTRPVHQVKRMAESQGFELEIEAHHRSAEEAKETILCHLNNGEPVVINWAPHLAMIYGYGYKEEGGKRELYFLVHDPADPNTPAGVGRELSFEKGPAHPSKYSAWEEDPILAWGRQETAAAGYPVYTFHKKSDPMPVSLSRLLEESADRTLGVGSGKDPEASADGDEHFGVEGIRACARALPQSFDRPFRFAEAFYLGEGPRRDAASFWDEQARKAADYREREAFATVAKAFRDCADAFGKAQAVMEGSLQQLEKGAGDPPEKKTRDGKEAATKVARQMEKIARAEERLGRILRSAAGATAGLP